MDETAFIHLRPTQRAAEFAAEIGRFIADCPKGQNPQGPYWQLVRFGRSFDWYGETRARHPTATDQYRVRTKVRRTELKWAIYFLEFVDVYGEQHLENQRTQLIKDGKELLGIYDAIINACSPKAATPS
jgi:hypothetical protein